MYRVEVFRNAKRFGGDTGWVPSNDVPGTFNTSMEALIELERLRVMGHASISLTYRAVSDDPEQELPFVLVDLVELKELL